MHPEAPADPFGLLSTGRDVWAAMDRGGCHERMLARQAPDYAAAQRAILACRVRGEPWTGRARPMMDLDTLHHFLDLDEARGGDVRGPRKALAAWRAARAVVIPYMTGRCHEFALAGHRLTGWGMVLVTGPRIEDPTVEEAGHVVLMRPDGLAMDVMGARELEDVRLGYGGRALPVDEDSLLARRDLAVPVDLEEAEAVFRRAAGAWIPEPEALSPGMR